MGRHFFLQDKNDRKLHEDTCIFICTNLNSIMGLFRANNIVANFWMLFATLSAYGVVASEVGPEVDREALAHVASGFFWNPQSWVLDFFLALITCLSRSSESNNC